VAEALVLGAAVVVRDCDGLVVVDDDAGALLVVVRLVLVELGGELDGADEELVDELEVSVPDSGAEVGAPEPSLSAGRKATACITQSVSSSTQAVER
jgi:hypothetical protein